MTTSTSQTSPTDSLAARLGQVRAQISAKAGQLGLEREPTLVVVTKNHPASLVAELIHLGECHFGENRDQEASRKALEVSELNQSDPVTWHFVGQLQSNKVKSVLGYSKWIHTLDRDSLLAELSKRTSDLPQASIKVFVEVNLTDRSDRGGVNPADVVRFATGIASAPGLDLVGLMAVARAGVDPRIDFERVATLRQSFLAAFPKAKLLSMGMSGDFLQAMEFGATHLRIGSAITGHRTAQN